MIKSLSKTSALSFTVLSSVYRTLKVGHSQLISGTIVVQETFDFAYDISSILTSNDKA